MSSKVIWKPESPESDLTESPNDAWDCISTSPHGDVDVKSGVKFADCTASASTLTDTGTPVDSGNSGITRLVQKSVSEPVLTGSV